MKTEKRIITINKKEQEVEVNVFETLQELMIQENSIKILAYFNYRHIQLQCQALKKALKPRKIPIKERRMMAFNSFTKIELKKFQNNAQLFEQMMSEKLAEIEKQLLGESK